MNIQQPQPRSYFRTPSLAPAGDRLAFVYAGDIWLVDAGGGDAERLTGHPSGHAAPRWSPAGQQIAFSSSRTGGGDIYVLALDGGNVCRVTYHDVASTPEDWSADGAHLFFSSARERQGTALYRVAAAGGTPVRWLAQPYEVLAHLRVAPDGSRLAFNVNRDPWWRRGPNPYGGSDIWLVSNAPDATDFHKIGDYAGMNRWPLWATDGQGLYFVSDRDGAENIWFQPLDGSPARHITDFAEGRVLWPSISRDGRIMVFERDFGIWRLDLEDGTLAPLPIRVRPDTKMTPVRVQTYTRDLSELALAPDGKKIAFAVRGELFADFADKETDKERRQGPAFRITNTSARESDVAWSPDSRALVYTSARHGEKELFRYDVAARTETRLTDDQRSAARPCFSPDGKWIAYACGDDQIRLLNVETRADRGFVSAYVTYFPHFTWSPDSRWLVYVAQDERLFSNLYVQRIDEDTPRQITFLSNLSARRPLWSPSGDFILFTTSQYRAEAQIARVDLRPQPPTFREEEFEKLFADEQKSGAKGQGTGNRGQEIDDRGQAAEVQGQGTGDEGHKEEAASQAADERAARGEEKVGAPATTQKAKAASQTAKSIEIVFEGIERRLRFLTPSQMDAHALAISPDSRDLLFSATVAGKQNLWAMALDEPRTDQPPRQLTSSQGFKWWAQFAPDGKSFYFLENGQVAVRKFPKGDQTSLPVSAEVVVDFNQEKQHIFEECWRLLRDNFYDPTFRGLDWSVAREQFAPLVAGAQTPHDLHTLLNMMVGELRASHLGVGSSGLYTQDGYTGLVFDSVEQAATGHLQIVEITPDSPAALAGTINIGEYLVAVNDVSLGPEVSLDSLLQRTVGRRVRLRVGPRPNPHNDTREVAVRPVSSDQHDRLCYRAWTLANEAYVHRISGGRLGYVHIREMSYNAYQQFLADLDAETHSKEGVVIDVRFNGGGYIATFLLDVLARRSVLVSAYRGRVSVDAGHFHGNRVLSKPTVLVINEKSLSNTEAFVEGYRRLGLGTVVGRPTGGAVIGTIDWRLLDGANLRLPRVRVATLEGEDLEGTGRLPDIDVPLPLGASARGQDPQLDAAVRALLAQLDGPL